MDGERKVTYTDVGNKDTWFYRVMWWFFAFFMLIALTGIAYTVHTLVYDMPAYDRECEARGGTLVNDNSKSLWDHCWNVEKGTRIFIDGH